MYLAELSLIKKRCLVLMLSSLLAACTFGSKDKKSEMDNPQSAKPTAEQIEAAKEIDQLITKHSGIHYNSQQWLFVAVSDSKKNNTAKSNGNKGEDKLLSVADIDKVKAMLGKVVSTDKGSLDYEGSLATQYEFMSKDVPNLNIIDSKKYVELNWYYANNRDMLDERLQSIANAKKAHDLAQKLMSKSGANMVKKILAGDKMTDKKIGNKKYKHTISMAKCELNKCMIVINK